MNGITIFRRTVEPGDNTWGGNGAKQQSIGKPENLS